LPQSAPAKDLFEVLLNDEVSKSLLKQNNYVITLNNAYLLTIRNSTVRLDPSEQATASVAE
jgi:hypothetical protein